jgi:hypothetical protein
MIIGNERPVPKAISESGFGRTIPPLCAFRQTGVQFLPAPAVLADTLKAMRAMPFTELAGGLG